MSDEPPDIVIQWDVVDGNMLGATTECRSCEGRGFVELTEDHRLGDIDTCPTCNGDRELHRPYYLPDGQLIAADGQPYSLNFPPEEEEDNPPPPQVTFEKAQGHE